MTCVLSGMNSEEMVIDNINTVSAVSVGELSAEGEEMLSCVVNAINARMKVDCGKCKKHCPQGIDIPKELKNVKGKLEGPLYRIGKRCSGCSGR